ncbi:hypothetical protein FXO37_11169 [Capsicum annuum]|nr:hypothetical protein FXO37_11169 [Capsicum annuum]
MKSSVSLKGSALHKMSFFREASSAGCLPGGIADTPTLQDIRCWVSSTWKHVHRVNIYEMGQNRFLFDFPSKTTVEYILRGETSQTPTIMVDANNGIDPLLRSNRTGLDQIGWTPVASMVAKCIQRTEEETQLRNHLKWARILVRGNGDTIPKTINIEHEGINFSIQIWCELSARFSPSEGSKERTSDHRLIVGSSFTRDGA